MTDVLTVGTPRTKGGKRAPTTPLALVNVSFKRQLAAKNVVSEPHSSIIDTMPASVANYKIELLEAKFENWALEKRLLEEKDTREFLELERKALMGTL